MSGALSPEVKQPELEAEHSRELMLTLRMGEGARLTHCTVLSCEGKGTTFWNYVSEKMETYTICLDYTKL
jgi:hypothetical protein